MTTPSTPGTEPATAPSPAGRATTFAVADLRDTLTVATLRDCEFIDRTAVGDGPPATALGRRLRVTADGSAVVPISCPRRARVACRGTLTARTVARRPRVIGTARYALSPGGRGRVAISLTRVPRTGTRLLLQTRERGVSRLGPRGSTRQVTVIR